MTWYCGFDKIEMLVVGGDGREGKALMHSVLGFCVFGLRIEGVERRWKQVDG